MIPTKTLEKAIEISKKVISTRFPNCHMAFCAGSIVRGEGTAHSDIDLVVVYSHLKVAWRESFFEEEWPIEAFVHDASTLRYFFEEVDAKSGVPSLPQMVSEGVLVFGENSAAEPLKRLAQHILSKGPAPLGLEEQENLIYAITDLTDDMKSPRSKAELFATATRLYPMLGTFALRSGSKWAGTGKHLPRALHRADPALATQFNSAFDKLFAAGEPERVIKLVEELLQPFGGTLFEGYKREAPENWRK